MSDARTRTIESITNARTELDRALTELDAVRPLIRRSRPRRARDDALHDRDHRHGGNAELTLRTHPIERRMWLDGSRTPPT